MANPAEALRWGADWDDRAGEAPWRPLPTTVEAITRDWLTTALSARVQGLEVNGFEVTKVRHGFTSVIHIALELNEAGRKAGVPERVVLKGGFTAFSRTYAYQYAMEAHGYRDVWPVIEGMNRPACHFIDIDPAARQSIIIMEDVNARGVTWGHGLRPLNYQQLARRLSMLAGVHAQTWGSPELAPGGRWDSVLENGARLLRMHMDENGYIIPDDDLFQGDAAGFRQTPPFFSPEGWALIWEQPQNAAASVHFRDREWCRSALIHLEHLNRTLPVCINHADTHLGNQYEEPDGTPGFVDWLPQRQHAAYDVAYTIGCCLDPLDRRKWERGLVAHYVAELTRHGVTMGYEEMYRLYCLFLLQGYMVFVINDTTWQTSAFNTVNVWRFCQAMIDNDVKSMFDRAFAGAS